MDATYVAHPQMAAVGLLIARLVLGLLMAAHGSQKLFGWFGGRGLNATGEYFVHLGFRPGRLFATAAAVGELASGLLVAVGFLGPVGPALMIAVMLVAAVSANWANGLFATSNGIEVPLLYATGALGLALLGPGPYSLDALLDMALTWTPRLTWVVLAIGILGALANLLVRRKPAASGGA